MKRHWRVFWSFAKVYWQTQTQYRLGSLIWIINGFISPLILMGIWLAVASVRNDVSDSVVVTYYLLTMVVVRLTQSWSGEGLARMIKDGTFSKYIVKPFSIPIDRLALDLALRTVRLLSMLPFILPAFYLARSFLAINLSLITFTTLGVALILGYGINLLLDCIMGFLTFWLEESYGTFLFFMMIRDLLSGMHIPLLLMPLWLQTLARWSPFYGTIGFPIDILMGRVEAPQVVSYLFLMMAYFLGFLGLALFTYRGLIKHYTAVGN